MKEITKCSLLILMAFGLSSLVVLGQNVGINATGSAPGSSAMLDVSSTTKGVLIPRMSTSQRDGIASPENGLMIYNTDCNSFNYYNGSSWVPMNSLAGNAPSTPGSITGSTSQCANATGVAYSVTAVSGATSYTWTTPSGGTIASGQGTNSVTVNFGSSSGNICVTASNACATSDASCEAITISSAPSAPTANAATNIASTAFDANWSASSGATKYYLDVATDAGFTSLVTGYNNLDVGNVVTYTVNSNLTCATNYYYRIRPENSCGTGSNSNSVMTTTGGCCSGTSIFTYTGSDQNFMLPAGCTSFTVKMWGAGGGSGSSNRSNSSAGGGGGFAQGSFTGVTGGTNFTIKVGGGGSAGNPNCVPGAAAGGWPGGGAAGGWGCEGGSGGGYSGLMTTGGTPIIIAGAGGAGLTLGLNCTPQGAGGAGGGASGVAGGNGPGGTGGGGGTQVSGGTAGSGASMNGVAGSYLQGASSGIGGGGGGYYGGGCGGATGGSGGNCGGSSYTGGGGGGGSGYVGGGGGFTPTSTTNTAGSGTTPANTGDVDYVAGTGVGGASAGISGGNGYVIISYP